MAVQQVERHLCALIIDGCSPTLTYAAGTWLAPHDWVEPTISPAADRRQEIKVFLEMVGQEINDQSIHL